VHVLLIPALIAALIGMHLALMIRQEHTDFPAAGKTEATVTGHRLYPMSMAKAGGFFFIVFGVLAAARTGVLLLPAGLVHLLPRRLRPAVLLLGDPAVAAHRPAAVLGHRRNTRTDVHRRRPVPGHRSEDDQRHRAPRTTTCCSDPATCPIPICDSPHLAAA